MAFTSSPRQSHIHYPDSARSHDRGEFGQRAQAPHEKSYYSQDQNHHDYTNIPSARSGHERYRDDVSPYPNNGGSHAYSNTNNTPKEHDALARVEALAHHGRDRREEGGGRRNTADSVFNRQRAELAQQGRVFEDKDFPPVMASIYYSREASHHSIRWLKPVRICAPDRPLFVQGGFSRFDVKQGLLGDCWFVAAMACLCGPDHSQLLERVVPDKDDQSFHHHHYAGMFRFRFWHFGRWQEVVVDDYLPTSGGSLTFVHSTHRTEFWPALMEKAYAKLYGSYEALKGGRMVDSLTDLTGGVAETFVLRGKDANYPRNIVSVLFKALDRGALIGCGIDGEEGSELREAFLPNGLVSGHAYSVTGLRQVPLQGGDITLIRIRNPHGSKNEWRGAWSDGSREWQQVHPKERERLGLVRRNDGEFWMDFREFMQEFDSLVVCNLTPDAPITAAKRWHTSHHHGRWVKHFNAGGRPSCTDTHWTNPQYVLRLQDGDEDDDSSCSVIVQLMQKDRRRLKQRGEVFHFIGFILYKVPSGFSTPLKKDFFHTHNRHASCDCFSNARQNVKRFVLPPGVYVVVPCTYDKDEEADFFIRFFFEKGNVSEYADEPPEKVEVPPPTPSPKHREQEEQFQKFFYEMSGEDMEINCFELHKAVNEALRKEPLHREVGLDACRSFVSLMDVDNSGRLGYTEFLYLWSMLRSWKKTFLQHDADNSGKMDSRELRTALASTGYKINNQMMAAAIFRYADARGHISLDGFLILMARLTALFNVYQKHLKKEGAVFTLEQWVEESLRL